MQPERIQLFPMETRPAVQLVDALSLDDECTLCGRYKGATTVCMPAEGPENPVGDHIRVLVVGMYPGREEDRLGRPNVGESGNWIRSVAGKIEGVDFFWDNALKCFASGDAKETELRACRPYLKRIIDAVEPDRIVCTGAAAIKGIFERGVDAGIVPGGYSWLRDPTIPVFVLPHPLRYMRDDNPYLLQEWAETLERVCTDPVPQQPPWNAYAEVITPGRIRAFLDEVNRSRWIAVDTETDGYMHNDDFRVVCAAVYTSAAITRYFGWGKGSCDGWVWDEQALRNKRTLRALKRAVKAKPLVAYNASYDDKAVSLALFRGEKYLPKYCSDPMLSRKLLAPISKTVKLDVVSWTAGFGGHKTEAEKLRLKTRTKVKANAKNALLDQFRDRVNPQWIPESGRKPSAKALLEKLVEVDGEVEAEMERFGRIEWDAYSYAPLDREILLRYCALDTMAAGALYLDHTKKLRKRENKPLKRTLNTQVPLQWALARMEQWGHPADLGQLHRTREFFVAEERRTAQPIIDRGYNPESQPQMQKWLYEDEGLTPPDGSAIKTGYSTLEKYLKMMLPHPAPQRLLDYRKASTFRKNFVEQLLFACRDDGRFHCSYLPHGTVTGRLACVVGDTPIETTTGVKAARNIVAGDFVWSHKERWCKVKRAWKVGVRPTYTVKLCTGDVLTCSDTHRLLTSSGNWVSVEEMYYECLKNMGKQPKEPTISDRPVQRRRPSANPERGSHTRRDDSSQRAVCGQSLYSRSGAEGAKSLSVFVVKNWNQKPDEGEDEGQTPQLERTVRRRMWVLNLPTSGETCLCAPSSDGPNDRNTDQQATANPCGSPHRRGHRKQLPQQPSTSERRRPQCYPLLAGKGGICVAIDAINYCGYRPVFDLTVDEDESYLNCGVYSHNSAKPNLQNMPKRSDLAKLIRNIFTSLDGDTLFQVDLSQLELRVAAAVSGDPVMIDIFRSGEDYHHRTAQLIAPIVWKKDPALVERTGPERALAKVVNFSLAYMKGVKQLAEDLSVQAGRVVTEDEAQAIYDAILGQLSVFCDWRDETIDHAYKDGGVWTFWAGEKCRFRALPALYSRDRYTSKEAEREAVNSPIQGSAAEFCNRALITMVDWICDGREHLANLTIPVHDSMLFTVREDFMPELARKAVTVLQTMPLPIMAGPHKGEKIDLIADSEYGPRWGELEEIPDVFAL